MFIVSLSYSNIYFSPNEEIHVYSITLDDGTSVKTLHVSSSHQTQCNNKKD